MTKLRQKMVELMVLKGFAESTQQTYTHQIVQLAKYYHRSPDSLSESELRDYLLYCHQHKHWSFSSCRQFIHAARFLFDQVLQQPLSNRPLPLPRPEQKIPELLSRNEVRRILTAAKNLKHYTFLNVCYAAGLRVSELSALQVKDLDGDRNTIRVESGKGRKDRNTLFTESLKQVLRKYWHFYHPTQYVFYGRMMSEPLSISAMQRAYSKAKKMAGIKKRGGIHALRHAFATHQLESGMPLPRLQKLLGHGHISSTLRYTRWLPHYQSGTSPECDLLNDWQ